MKKLALICFCFTLGFGYASPASAIEPVNPDATPEVRALLDYLASIYGKKTLVGQNKFGEAERAHEASGRYPAIISVDLSGWSKEKWSPQYKRTLQWSIKQMIEFSKEKGGIVSMEWHWSIPTSGEGTYEATKVGFKPFDIGRAVTPGTEEYRAVMDDFSRHADYLEQLRDAGVPVLWRPLHEIDGGWFWWTDKETPENTARLWRMMYDYMVGQRKLNNLIWVYSAALKACDKGKDVEAIEYRKRFYPGDKYVDISGIDIYTNSWFGWKDYREDTHVKAFEIMSRVTPGKMLALCECQGIPNPDLLEKQGPGWLYCLPWYVGNKDTWNPPEWVKRCYPHDRLITLDELPDLKVQH